MHFSVIGEHRDFFRKQHWIECEGLLTQKQLSTFQKGVETVIHERLKDSPKQSTPEKIFEAGHDLWRGLPALKKLILQKELGEIASELIEHKPLRFGYDQLFPTISTSVPYPTSFRNFLSTTPTLQEMSAIQGVLSGAIICVKAPEKILTDEKENPLEGSTTSFFPKEPGNVIFFSPEVPISFNALKEKSGGLYLLLVYVKSNAVYFRQDKDPHVNAFRQLGYNFGDKLLDRLNPLVYQ